MPRRLCRCCIPPRSAPIADILSHRPQGQGLPRPTCPLPTCRSTLSGCQPDIMVYNQFQSEAPTDVVSVRGLYTQHCADAWCSAVIVEEQHHVVVASVNQDSDGRGLHAALRNRSSAPARPPPRSTMLYSGFSSAVGTSMTQRMNHACPPEPSVGGLHSRTLG